MPNVFATKNGNWSDTTVWNTGSLPTSIDDVFANNFSVVLDQDVNVLTLRNTAGSGITQGGSFTFGVGTTNRSVTASILCGNGSTLNLSHVTPYSFNLFGNLSGSFTSDNSQALLMTGVGTINIVGNVIGGSAPNPGGGNYRAITNSAAAGVTNILGDVFSRYGPGIVSTGTATFNITGNAIGVLAGNAVSNQGAGIINIFGNATGGTGSAVGANNASSGTVNIFGNVRGGSFGGALGASNGSTGTINIFGNVTGGTVNNVQGASNGGAGTINVVGFVSAGNIPNIHGIVNQSTGTINVTGIAYGGGSGQPAAGLRNSSTGRIFLYGTAIGGGANPGIENTSTGLIYATRAKGNDFGIGSVGISGPTSGISNTQNGLAYVEELEFGSRGTTPASGPIYIIPKINNTIVTVTTANGSTNTFYTSLSVSNLLPPVSSVRAGVIYNAGASVGTMVVPTASAVQAGVPIDNAVGIALLTPLDVWNLPLSANLNSNTFGDRLKSASTVQSVGNLIASYNS